MALQIDRNDPIHFKTQIAQKLREINFTKHYIEQFQ